MPKLSIHSQMLHYEKHGDGSPTLVFIHGATCDLTNWQAQFDFFKETHTVVGIDLNGHGESKLNMERLNCNFFADDITELIKKLELSDVILIGHSMGCRVAVQTATQSEMVKALVLVDGAYLVHERPPENEKREEIAKQTWQRVRSVFETHGVREQQRDGIKAMFFDEKFSNLRDDILNKALQLPEEQILTLMPNFAAWDTLNLDKAVEAAKQPMLVFQSTYMNEHHQRQAFQKGATTPWLELIKDYAPQATIKEVYDAGHFLMMEQPKFVNHEIQAFVKSL